MADDDMRVATDEVLPCPGENCKGKVAVDTDRQSALHFPDEPCVWFRDTHAARIIEYVLGTRGN